MDEIEFEQALLVRGEIGLPSVQARSPGFSEEWIAPAQQVALDFGDRPSGMACPEAVFALPLTAERVALVRAFDVEAIKIAFHFVVVRRHDYEKFLGDPFAVLNKIPQLTGAEKELPPLHWPGEPLPARTLDQVKEVLLRLKVHALPEDADPEKLAEIPRTEDNSESPALLGGVQVLVDGGKLVFRRPGPEPRLLEGLWMLLPHSTRSQLWPASFAFGNRLGFDVVVVPHLDSPDLAGYTSEERALDYPEGYYELHLQIAAESNDQAGLDRMLYRRSSRETWRLGLVLVVMLSLFVLMGRFANSLLPPPGALREPAPPADYAHRAAAAGAMISAGDPWAAWSVLLVGQNRWRSGAKP